MKKLFYYIIFVTLIFLSGCPSPAALKPVADQNAVNIKNYTSNVEALAEALKKELRFHTEIAIQIARNNLANKLIDEIRIKCPLKKHDDPAISEPSKQWNIDLKKIVDNLKVKISEVKDNENALDLLAAENPAIFDVAMDKPGFTITRVLQDSIRIDNQNKLILRDSNKLIIRAHHTKRNEILDEYSYIKKVIELNKAYIQAIDEYISVLKEQGIIARSHANSILTYTQTPNSLKISISAFQDKELRDQVLDIVTRKKGEAYAKKLNNYLSQMDDVINILKF
jgi:hypothetical protein